MAIHCGECFLTVLILEYSNLQPKHSLDTIRLEDPVVIRCPTFVTILRRRNPGRVTFGGDILRNLALRQYRFSNVWISNENPECCGACIPCFILRESNVLSCIFGEAQSGLPLIAMHCGKCSLAVSILEHLNLQSEHLLDAVRCECLVLFIVNSILYHKSLMKNHDSGCCSWRRIVDNAL